jgi:hypothetical protein
MRRLSASKARWRVREESSGIRGSGKSNSEGPSHNWVLRDRYHSLWLLDFWTLIELSTGREIRSVLRGLMGEALGSEKYMQLQE